MWWPQKTWAWRSISAKRIVFISLELFISREHLLFLLHLKVDFGFGTMIRRFAICILPLLFLGSFAAESGLLRIEKGASREQVLAKLRAFVGEDNIATASRSFASHQIVNGLRKPKRLQQPMYGKDEIARFAGSSDGKRTFFFFRPFFRPEIKITLKPRPSTTNTQSTAIVGEPKVPSSPLPSPIVQEANIEESPKVESEKSEELEPNQDSDIEESLTLTRASHDALIAHVPQQRLITLLELVDVCSIPSQLVDSIVATLLLNPANLWTVLPVISANSALDFASPIVQQQFLSLLDFLKPEDQTAITSLIEGCDLPTTSSTTTETPL